MRKKIVRIHSPGLNPAKKQVADYIVNIAGELMHIANNEELSFLAYLLGMARAEALHILDQNKINGKLISS